MSKTSTATVEEEKSTATEESTTTQTVKKEKKYTVYRFLQLRPQPTGYGTLLKKHYGNEWHTLDEWEELMQKILNRKVK